VSCSWPKWRRLEADLWIDGEPELSTCTARQRRCHERKAPHGGEHCEMMTTADRVRFEKWTLECIYSCYDRGQDEHVDMDDAPQCTNNGALRTEPGLHLCSRCMRALRWQCYQ